MKRIYILALMLGLLTGFTACSDGEGDNYEVTKYSETEIPVDVILPKDVWNNAQNVISWAQENIEKAQKTLTKRVKLKINWVNEDETNIDSYANNLQKATGPDTVQAIIGPYYSANATTLLARIGSQNKKNFIPIVAPTASSVELQRLYANNTTTWFLTESDITQCNIILTTAKNLGAKSVMLYYSDDNYGQSFRDWFGYQAGELDLDVAGINKYEANRDIETEIGTLIDASSSVATIFALSSEDDYIAVGRRLNEAKTPQGTSFANAFSCPIIFADVAASQKVINSLDRIYGIMPYADPSSGFSNLYELHYDRTPLIGESQLYDALTLIALGALAQLYELTPSVDGHTPAPTINEHMRSLATATGSATTWDADGLAEAARLIAAGTYPNISGASGELNFDAKTHTKVIASTYAYYYAGPSHTTVNLRYLSTAGAPGTESAQSIWEWESTKKQNINDTGITEQTLPPTDQRWAVVGASSTQWKDYRHQADAYAMYAMLIDNGYQPDHIILIVEDNLAYSTYNSAYPGKIFIEDNPQSEVRRGVTPDYVFSSLSPDDLNAILCGQQSDRLPKVVQSDADDNIFFFWSGHGTFRRGFNWGNTYYTGEMMKNAITRMNAEGRYRRMLLAIETCYSGLIGEAIEQAALPNVVALTAANANEESISDVYSTRDGLDLGITLSNAFARQFRNDINQNHTISLYDLWLHLARLTQGSHVTLYNYRNYGSTRLNTMGDYFE